MHSSKTFLLTQFNGKWTCIFTLAKIVVVNLLLSVPSLQTDLQNGCALNQIIAKFEVKNCHIKVSIRHIGASQSNTGGLTDITFEIMQWEKTFKESKCQLKDFQLSNVELSMLTELPFIKYVGGFVTARIRRITEGNVFIISTTGEYPIQSWWGRGEAVPHPVPMKGGTLARSVWGTPPPNRTGSGTPQSGLDGYPPLPGDRAPQWVLAMRRAVCLLRSRRRTFLF